MAVALLPRDASTLAMDLKLVLFDAVTYALDPELVGEVLAAMQQLARDDMAMAPVTYEIPKSLQRPLSPLNHNRNRETIT